jgi:hypothetical protein
MEKERGGKMNKMLIVGIIMALIAGAALPLSAEQVKRQATITDITGEASVKLIAEKAWVPAAIGMTLTEGDTIKTKKGASLVLRLEGADTATVEVSEESELLLREFTEDKALNMQKTLLDLALGEVLIRAEKLSPDSKFEVKTPSSVAGVRGTKFSVKVEAVE